MSTHTNKRAAADETVLRVRGPADLVAAIPYLVGFHPARSLVLLGLDPNTRGRIRVTARVDLDDVAASPATLERTLAGLARGKAHTVTAAVFDDDARPDIEQIAEHGVDRLPWAGLAREVGQITAQYGLDLDEIMLVSGGRSWSYLCDEECCPPEGRELDSSSVPAECTYAGLVALPDRAALEATLDPLPDDERERLLFALDLAEYDAVGVILKGADTKADRSDKRALFAAARAAQHGVADVPDEQVVRFGVALQRISVRDAVWLAIDDGRIDGRALWRDLARRLPVPFDAPPLFLYAWASYRDGNGALAGMAAERALGSDPGYRAADFVLAALANALDPRTLPKLRPRRRSA